MRSPRFGSLRRLLLAAVALTVTLVACGGQAPSGTPSSSSSPAPSASPSAVPSESPAAPSPSAAPSEAAGITIDSIARVVTDDLRVRSKPEVSDQSELLTPLLQPGQLVYVVDGPVSGSGYAWYQVAPIQSPGDVEAPFGWVAAADKTGESWLQAGGEDCPATPATFGDVFSTPPLVALACFGDEGITFRARVMAPEATCGIDIGWTIQPDWLGGTCPQPEFVIFDDSDAESVYSVIEPEVDTSGIEPGVEPAQAVDVVITGQLDHPEARSCKVDVYEPDAGPDPDIAPEEAVLICRATFVITGIEAAGT